MEKKATSEPEIKAELISNTIITNNDIATGSEIELKVNSSPVKGIILEGSNEFRFFIY